MPPQSRTRVRAYLHSPLLTSTSSFRSTVRPPSSPSGVVSEADAVRHQPGLGSAPAPRASLDPRDLPRPDVVLEQRMSRHEASGRTDGSPDDRAQCLDLPDTGTAASTTPAARTTTKQATATAGTSSQSQTDRPAGTRRTARPDESTTPCSVVRCHELRVEATATSSAEVEALTDHFQAGDRGAEDGGSSLARSAASAARDVGPRTRAPGEGRSAACALYRAGLRARGGGRPARPVGRAARAGQAARGGRGPPAVAVPRPLPRLGSGA